MSMYRVVVSLFLFLQGVTSTSVYDPLVTYIKSKSNPLLIPRSSADKPLVVDFQAGWLDIQNVNYEQNEIEGIFATSVSWNSGIAWNPADFNNKTSVVLSSSDVYNLVVTIINIVGKLESWHGERISLYSSGGAVLRTHFRGTIFCNEELRESNTCRLRVASYSTPSNVISFLKPAKRHYDLRKIYDKYYFKGSRFKLASHNYEIHEDRAEDVNMVFEYMDYVFSLEQNESNAVNRFGPKQAIFEFY